MADGPQVKSVACRTSGRFIRETMSRTATVIPAYLSQIFFSLQMAINFLQLNNTRKVKFRLLPIGKGLFCQCFTC
jgi:hypothetical protein